MERVTERVGRSGRASDIIGEKASTIGVMRMELYDERVTYKRRRVTRRLGRMTGDGSSERY